MSCNERLLKIYRGARKYILMQHDVTLDELELLLYLKGCGKFSAEDLERFEGLLKWDKNRLGKMIKKGVVGKFRNAVPGRMKALYEVTIKGKKICNSFYKMLETGEFLIHLAVFTIAVKLIELNRSMVYAGKCSKTSDGI